MDLLLDTHAFIWFMEGDKSLPPKSIKAIKNIGNKCYLSIASLWEIAIKISLKKNEIQADFNNIVDFLSNNEIEILSISFDHLQELLTLQWLVLLQEGPDFRF